MAFTGTKNAYADITKEKLCRTSEFISAKISPDGKLIAKVVVDESGIANVVVLPAKENSTSFMRLSSFRTPEIIQFFRSADSQKVLLLKDEDAGLTLFEIEI